MNLFVCNKCGLVDAAELAFPARPFPTRPEDQKCTMCQTGYWHGQFEGEPYNPENDNVINRPTGVGMS